MYRPEDTGHGCTAWTKDIVLPCTSDSSLIYARQNAEMFLKLTTVVHDDDFIQEQAMMGNVPLQDISQAMAVSAELWVLCEGPAPFAEDHISHELHAAPPIKCEQPYQLGNNARDSKRDAYLHSWAPGAESMHHSTAGWLQVQDITSTAARPHRSIICMGMFHHSPMFLTLCADAFGPAALRALAVKGHLLMRQIYNDRFCLNSLI